MLTLYTDEFQMLLQKSYIVLYLTEPGVQNAKEKSLPSTKGQASKDICWIGEVYMDQFQRKCLKKWWTAPDLKAIFVWKTSCKQQWW